MSRLFKSTRIVLDDKAFVLSSQGAPVAEEVSQAVDEAPKAPDPARVREALIQAAEQEAEQLLEQADAEAAERVERAERSAEAIVSEAYDQAKGIYEKAKEEGFEEGVQGGHAEGMMKVLGISEEAMRIKEDLLAMRRDLYEQSEAEMIALVLEALEKMLDYKMDSDTGMIENLIRQGIARVNQGSAIVVRVSNEDYNHALLLKPILATMSDKVEAIEIKRDPTLSNGACIIDTESGSIDSGIQTQLEHIRERFEGLLRAR